MKNRVFDSLIPEIQRTQIFKKENNLEGKDNLEEIPTSMAVFTVCGRINGYPANPRYTGVTENLRESIQALFNADDNVGEFMNSIKLKELLFQTIEESQFKSKKEEWENQFTPNCSEALNEVY